MSARLNVCMWYNAAIFFQRVCAVSVLKDKRVWICTDKIQSTKGRSDSSKRWIVVGAVVVIVVGVVEIINAANVNEFFFVVMPLVFRTLAVVVYATVDNIDGYKTASF